MAIETKILRAGQDSILMNVAPDVFDHPIDPNFAREFLEDPRHHLAVAIEDGVVVGFASGVHYLHPDKPPELWINEVGVAQSHRRRGVGTAVLRALFEVGLAHRCATAWVLTDHGNAAAIALYVSAGGFLGDDDRAPGKGTMMFTFALGGPEKPEGTA